MKTYEVPSKENWERVEYVAAQRRLAEYLKKDPPDLVNIKCDFCPKDCIGPVIHVVSFGKKVACRACYSKKFASKRVQWAKFEYPPDLVPQEETPTPNSDQQASDAEKACLELQNAECERIRTAGLEKDEVPT